MRDRGRRLLKRSIDVLGASIGLVFFAPLLLVVAVLIRAVNGSPVLFVQTRPGLDGRPFKMFKFRTMSDQRDSAGKPLPDANRLTWLGKLLRVTSIDELPELVNVLRGDMSLVGPRPLLMEYLSQYTPEEARRHEVKPGVTGWAQVNGRNAISWPDKFRYDVWYVDNWSIGLDARILLMTIWQVFRLAGVSAESHATMPRFERHPVTGTDAVEAKPHDRETMPNC